MVHSSLEKFEVNPTAIIRKGEDEENGIDRGKFSWPDKSNNKKKTTKNTIITILQIIPFYIVFIYF